MDGETLRLPGGGRLHCPPFSRQSEGSAAEKKKEKHGQGTIAIERYSPASNGELHRRGQVYVKCSKKLKSRRIVSGRLNFPLIFALEDGLRRYKRIM